MLACLYVKVPRHLKFNTLDAQMRSQPDQTNPSHCDSVPLTDLRNALRVMITSLVWATVFVGSSWILKADSSPTGFGAWAIVAVCVTLGVVALAAFRKYLLDADELTRKIQLEGLAFGFGAGLLFSLSYGLFHSVGAPDMSMTHAGTVLIVGYVVGVLRAIHQYS